MPKTGVPGSRALLVGSGACPALGLPQASDFEEDVRIVDSMLREHLVGAEHLEVRRLLEPSSSTVSAELAWLYGRSADTAVRVFYYSGHAVLLPSQEVALALKDSEAANPSSYVSASLLGQFLANCPDAEHVWLLDCCYAHAMSLLRLPEVVQGMLHHCVLSSSSAGTKSSGSLGPSPFTEAVSFGVRALAHHPSGEVLALSPLTRFLDAETSRRGIPRPYLHFSGAPSGFSFRPPIAPQATYQPRAVRGKSRRDPDRVAVAVGESSRRTHDQLARRAGLTDPAVRLDGRSPLMLEMSQLASGFTRGNPAPLIVDDVLVRPAWDQLLALADKRNIMASVPDADLVPDAVRSDGLLFHAPPLAEAEVVGVLSRLVSGAPGRAPDPQTLIDAAGNSMLDLVRLVRGAVYLERDLETYAAAGGSAPTTVHEVLRRLDETSPGAARVLQVAGCTPGIHLPVGILDAWARRLPAPDRLRKAQTAAQLRATGLAILVESGDWLLVPEVFYPDFTAALPQAGDLFVDFVESTLSERATLPLDPIARYQLVRACALFCERRMGAEGEQGGVERVLAVVGNEIFSTVSRSRWLPLIEDAETWLAEDAGSALLSVLGHAHRLSDDYDRSRRRFERAGHLAQRPEDRLTARTGLIRLDIQAGRHAAARVAAGDTLGAEGDPSAAASGALARSSWAHLANQRGNMYFRAGELTQAQRSYEEAFDLVSVRDPGTASLAVDILKGLGDVAMCLDQRETAAAVLDRMFGLIAANSLSNFGRTPEAKALQFAGDVARRQSVRPGDPVGDVNRRKVDESRYWYERAFELYTEQDLELGRLITRFKHLELDALTGDHVDALTGHLQLSHQFTALDNAYWAFRSGVAIVKLAPDAGLPGDAPLVAPFRAQVLTGTGEFLSPHEALWQRIALALVAPDPPADLRACAPEAAAQGVESLAEILAGARSGAWLYSYF